MAALQAITTVSQAHVRLTTQANLEESECGPLLCCNENINRGWGSNYPNLTAVSSLVSVGFGMASKALKL